MINNRNYITTIFDNIHCYRSLVLYFALLCPLLRAADNEPANSTKNAKRILIGAVEDVECFHYLDKVHRVVLTWKDRYDVFDSENVTKISNIDRPPAAPNMFCVSPDQLSFITSDSLGDNFNKKPKQLHTSGLAIWDTKNGKLLHTIRLFNQDDDLLWIREWQPIWLNNTRILIMKTWRKNPSRAVSTIQFFTIDSSKGEIIKKSDFIDVSGQYSILSPNGKYLLVKPDAFVKRSLTNSNVLSRLVYSPIQVITIDSLTHTASLTTIPKLGLTDESNDVPIIADWFPRSELCYVSSICKTNTGNEHNLFIWNPIKSEILHTLTGHKEIIMDVFINKNEDILITASEDKNIRVWETRTGALKHVLSGHSAGLNRVVMVNDDLVISAAEEPIVKIWDVKTGKLKYDLVDHDSAVRGIKVESDSFIQTTTIKGTVTKWNCITGKKVATLNKYPIQYDKCEFTQMQNDIYIGSRK